MLKQLIQRLLDSRTTPSEAGHSAMPSSSYITPTATAVQAWGQMAQGVAPFDGFVRASARASNTSSNIRVTNDTATVFAQSEGTATGQTQGVFVPVAKGDSWSVYGTNRDNVVVRLVKTIGGGYSYLVRRVLSCLRPSFNYLPRSFCKASILTLLISVGRVPTHRSKLSQEKRKGVMLHLSVVGQFFSSTPQQTTLGSRWRTLIERRFIALTQSAIAKQYLSQCRRATRLKSILEPTTKAQHILSLFATNRLSNLLTIGGALC